MSIAYLRNQVSVSRAPQLRTYSTQPCFDLDFFLASNYADINVPTKVDSTAAPEGKETLVVLVPVGHLLESTPNVGHQSNGHDFASAQSNGHANGHANGNVNGDVGSINIEKSAGKTVASQDWPKIIARARAQVLRKLTERFGDKLDLQGGDFGSLIETEVVNTPMTWRDNLNLYKGSILGLSHNILQVLCLRPRLIHDSIKVSPLPHRATCRW